MRSLSVVIVSRGRKPPAALGALWAKPVAHRRMHETQPPPCRSVDHPAYRGPSARSFPKSRQSQRLGPADIAARQRPMASSQPARVCGGRPKVGRNGLRCYKVASPVSRLPGLTVLPTARTAHSADEADEAVLPPRKGSKPWSRRGSECRPSPASSIFKQRYPPCSTCPTATCGLKRHLGQGLTPLHPALAPRRSLPR